MSAGMICNPQQMFYICESKPNPVRRVQAIQMQSRAEGGRTGDRGRGLAWKSWLMKVPVCEHASPPASQADSSHLLSREIDAGRKMALQETNLTDVVACLRINFYEAAQGRFSDCENRNRFGICQKEPICRFPEFPTDPALMGRVPLYVFHYVPKKDFVNK